MDAIENNISAGIYLFKVNNGNTRTMCEICSKLTKTSERRHGHLQGSRSPRLSTIVCAYFFLYFSNNYPFINTTGKETLVILFLVFLFNSTILSDFPCCNVELLYFFRISETFLLTIYNFVSLYLPR